MFFVSGAGFAADVESLHPGATARTRIDHLLEQGCHDIGVLRGDGLPLFHVLAIKLTALRITYGGDDARAHAKPLVGKGGVSLGQVEGGNGHSAEAD